MASVASQLIEEVTAHAQSDSLEDAREICADGTYFPNNLSIIQAVIGECEQFSFEKLNSGSQNNRHPTSPANAPQRNGEGGSFLIFCSPSGLRLGSNCNTRDSLL